MARIVISIPKSRFMRLDICFPPTWETVFIEPSEASFLAEIKGADILWVSSMHTISAAVIDASDRLKMIHTLGVGFNKIDLAAAARKGIYVCNSKAANSLCVAEHTLALILSSLRSIPYLNRECKKANALAAKDSFNHGRIRQIGDCHVGLIGFGDIGRALATYLQPFGCRISYYSRTRYPREIEELYHVQFLPFDDLLKECDLISLHIPSSPETINMIDETALKKMRSDVLLVNCSRGELIDNRALADALEAGTIAGCALDTIYPEYPGMDHPLLSLSPEASERLILTPHVAGASDTSVRRMLTCGMEDIETVLRGERPQHIQNGI